MSDVLMKALQLQVESLTRQVQQLAPENERVRQLLTDFTERHLVDEGRIAATLARAERAEAERVCAELDAAMADGKIRHALPTRFVLIPPDGGDVKTLEAVKDTVEALERAEALLAEAVEALRFYADESLTGYEVEVVDYGFTTKVGHIVNDNGDRARATLARIQGDSHDG